MKISVVLATYNGEKYIRRQILSILNQTIVPSEIIITDDKSTDKTLKIINDYMQHNPHINWIITSNKNKGFVTNFLNGIFCATGDIVFLSDQDDEWVSDKIFNYVQIFKNNTEATLIHGDIDVVDLDNNILKTKTQQYKNGVNIFSFNDFLKKPNYPGMSMAFKKSVIDKNKEFILANISNIKTHDYLLVMLSLFEGEVYTVGESYSARTYTGENVALRDMDNYKLNTQDRIDSAETYINQYTLVLKFICSNSTLDYQKERKVINKLLNAQKQRLNFLENGGIKKGVSLLMNARYLPSLKSLMGDLISIGYPYK